MGLVESNRFGTDEFLQYSEMVGVEPYVCINAGLGTHSKTRATGSSTPRMRHTYWAEQRRENGRDEPYNVKYWGLGNEIDGPWQLGHKNAEDYVEVRARSRQSHAARGRHDQADRQRLEQLPFGRRLARLEPHRARDLENDIDYISLHTYIGNRANDLERFLADPRTSNTASRSSRGRSGGEAGRPSRAPSTSPTTSGTSGTAPAAAANSPPAATRLEEIYNFEDALAMGMFFNSFIRHADIVKMANLAQIVNVIAPIFTNEKGLFLQPIYFPIAEYANSAATSRSTPGGVPHLPASATASLSAISTFR